MSARYDAAPHLLARAVAATVLVMGGTTLAHTWAGGALPDPSALAGLTAVVFGAGLLALRGLVRVPFLLAGVAVAQTGLHGAFGVLGTSAHAAHHAGHAVEATAQAPAEWTWQMLAAHALSTLLTTLVWHACARSAALVLALVGHWHATGPARLALPPTAGARVPDSLRCLVGAPRRGPPVGARLA